MKDILAFTFQELIGSVARNRLGKCLSMLKNTGSMLKTVTALNILVRFITHRKRTSLSLCPFIISFKFQDILTLPVPPEYF